MSACRHRMPFGAELDKDGRVRFRLWAPAADHVAVEIASQGDGTAVLDLSPANDGWFALTTDAASPGSRYRYRVSGPRTGGTRQVPDPASRFQPASVHGFSEVIDPGAFAWRDHGTGSDWRGRAWETAVLYELHVGTFTPEGTFAGAVTRGRRRELARFARLADAKAREAIPDPNDPDTFARSRLDWTKLQTP